MRVVVIGPNIMQPGTTGFHVHAAGCRDIRRPKYLDAPSEVMDVETVETIAREVYSDHIREAGDPSDISSYIADFTVLPCAAALK
jgi:hypothetical protein